MKMKLDIRKVLVFVLFQAQLALLPAADLPAQNSQMYDLLIVHGRVMDGSGNPWFYADIGVRNGKIAFVGHTDAAATARRTIDARGKTVVPGFIDLHSHAFDSFRRRTWDAETERKLRAAPNMVAQGVTTLVTNQDGRGPLSIAKQRKQLQAHGGVGPNTILLIGHGSVRAAAMGDDFRREATAAEIAEMQRRIRRAMDEGAWGLSAGLEYVPGRWSTTAEMVALVSTLKASHGLLIEHERGSGLEPMWFYPSQDPPGAPGMIQSILESIEIAERTGVTVVATHIKARGAHFWGASRTLIRLLTAARNRGVPIYADQYPYNTSGSDGNTTLIPPWARKGSETRAQVEKLLADRQQAANLRQDIAYEITRRGGAENIIIMAYPDSSLIGKSIAETAKQWQLTPVEVAIRLQREGFPERPGGARLRAFSMSEIDVEAFAQQPWVATASDAGLALPGRDAPFLHARFYGTFPRKIRRYALDRGVISVEQAIRSMTSLPAQILELKDRGVIRAGAAADLVILDLQKIRDTATFFDIHQYPEGIDEVLVNGVFVVENGKLTWKLPGKLLTK